MRRPVVNHTKPGKLVSEPFLGSGTTRAAAEVTHVYGRQMAPAGTAVMNPAFDVTPARYVTGIITERGVARAPYQESLRKLVG